MWYGPADRDVNDRQTEWSCDALNHGIAEGHAEADTPGGQAMPVLSDQTPAGWQGHFLKEIR